MMYHGFGNLSEKRAKKLYEACGVVLCVLLNLTMCFLVFDFLNIFMPFEKRGNPEHCICGNRVLSNAYENWK